MMEMEMGMVMGMGGGHPMCRVMHRLGVVKQVSETCPVQDVDVSIVETASSRPSPSPSPSPPVPSPEHWLGMTQ